MPLHAFLIRIPITLIRGSSSVQSKFLIASRNLKANSSEDFLLRC
jgi:hypothetical protein